MMLLAIDIGNSNSVLALIDGAKIVRQWRVETGDIGGALDVPWSDVADVVMCSVVPSATVAMKSWLAQHTKAAQSVVCENLHVPMIIEMDDPDEVGADRLVAAFAVWQQSKVASIVVDFGTATTFDVIDADGHYQGGVIAPGVRLSLAALEQAAAKLPKIRLQEPTQLIGKSTVAAMQSGMFYGYLALVDGVVARLKNEYDVQQVIATGGLASYYAPHSAAIDRAEEDLILHGLATLARHHHL